MKYYVINIIKDVKGTAGKSIVKVVSEKDYKGEKDESTKTYDQYVDEFSSKEDAEAWVKTLREEAEK